MFQRFPDGVAMDEILGFEVHPRLLEAGQDVIVKGDVGLPGVEQDPIAIKGNQLDQTMHPGNSGVQLSANDLASGAGTENYPAIRPGIKY